ncbi:MAG: GNAT family N-acetyltransferase [Phyllobacterium sp.]
MTSHGNVVCGRSQTAEWVQCWQKHVNSDCVLAGASIDEQPFFLLPLEIVRTRYATVARFPGGSHANSNFPVVVKSGAAALTPHLMRELLKALHKARPDIDLISLDRQLNEIDGISNPLFHLDRITNPNPVFSAALSRDFASYLKRFSAKRKLKKRRQQERRFGEAGDYRIRVTSSKGEADALLDCFYEIKAKRLMKAGIRDVFADAKIRTFFKALAELSIVSEKDILQIKALEIGGIPRAIIGASLWMGVRTSEFCSISDDEFTSASPGEYLFFQDIEESCARGIHTYSFGIGEDPYKHHWCDTETNLFDTYRGVSAKGKLLAALLQMRVHGERRLKQQQALWQFIRRMRRVLKRQK